MPETFTSATAASASPLRARRCARGWSLRELADLSGCSREHLSRVERGERAASANLQVTLSRVLAQPISRLFPDHSQ